VYEHVHDPQFGDVPVIHFHRGDKMKGQNRERERGRARSRTSRVFIAIASVCVALALAALVGAGPATLTGAAPARSDVVPGGAQSPIDLRRPEIMFVDRLPAIGFSYPREADITLTNTGSPDEEATVRADVPAGASITLRGKQYDLQQFHWHTPSEHRIGGRSRPIEMHLVHSAADGSLLVIGVFIKRGQTNRVLEPIFDDLPETADETRQVAGVRIDDLLPDDRSSFRYVGSLTTPPFTEGVRWIVLTHPIRLSKLQIGAFREVFPDGNTREVQPLNGRRVLSDDRRPDRDNRG
jgi:carbonic anhydrase